MALTEEQQRVEAWIWALDPAQMPPAPDAAHAQAINLRATEGHPCAYCRQTARCAYVGTRFRGKEVPPFWLDLCPPHARDVRYVLDWLAQQEGIQF